MARESNSVYWAPMQNYTAHPTTAASWPDNKTRRADGVIERQPIRAHASDDYEDRKVHPHAGRRYVMVVRHEGHTVPLLLTNAAAHLDSNTSYGIAQRLKARALGWYLLHAPLCRQLKDGSVRRSSIVSDEVRANRKLCAAKHYEDGCPCSKKERAARIAVQTAKESASAIAEAAKTNAEANVRDAAVGAATARALAEVLGPMLKGKS